MGTEDLHFRTDELDMSIEDDGRLHNLSDIVVELKRCLDNSSASAMSDHALFLQGKKEMLTDVISYLERMVI